MTKFFRSATVIFSLFLSASPIHAQGLAKFLKAQKSIQFVEEIPGHSFFQHNYIIRVRQPLNYKDTLDGFFLQRVFVAEKHKSSPTVFITEGYAADYAKRPGYQNELSELLQANQICVEHRYFGESSPDSVVWKHLTVENAANDHHRIVQLLKPYFEGKWLNTGISKGGQTALAHRCFFPNDVDLTVAYVAPLNFGVEDGRHEPFLEKVGSDSCRSAILRFQREVLKRRDEIKPLLQNYCKTKACHSKLPYDQLLDFVVLEYPFAFWQWGHAPGEIPNSKATNEALFQHLSSVSKPDYFTIEGAKPYVPFFYQAAHELGYYGYDTSTLKSLLSVQTTKNYLNQFMTPENTKVAYRPETSQMVDEFLRTEARNIILIYGENDPWTASAATINSHPSNIKIVAPAGSHFTRVKTLPPEVNESIIRQIQVEMKK
ncbi:S28 family serine protease [Mangrovibacterium sp.]|uniref:S28 family serine protease n=1 Tax=Mangrovibacterium sp. TaxID=1961364 RepID=UPI003564B6DC